MGADEIRLHLVIKHIGDTGKGMRARVNGTDSVVDAVDNRSLIAFVVSSICDPLDMA